MNNKRTEKERLQQVLTLTRQLLEQNISRDSNFYKEFSALGNKYIKEAKNQELETYSLIGYKATIILSTSRNVDCSVRLHKIKA
jgi:hypothetical protein